MSLASRYATVPPFPLPIRKVGAPLAAIIALGTLTALILTLLTAVNPGGTALGFGLATTALALVLLCYLWLDRWEPEPPRLLVLAFLWGASVAVLTSVLAEQLFEKTFGSGGDGSGGDAADVATVAIAAPIFEEAAKGAFLLLMMTGRRRNELNTLTDCLVYAGITAAGFAWLENIFYIASGETLGGSLAIAGLRLVIGPFAHPLFTTMIGIGVYYALKQRSALAKAAYVLIGYAAAVVMHGLWNGSALLGVKTYISVYLVWMVPIFGMAVALAVASRRREQRIVAAKLPAMVSGGLISSLEAAWMSSMLGRKTAVATAVRLGGRRDGKAVKRFALQVVELAYVQDRIDRGFGDERVFALQNDEVGAVAVSRAAAGRALTQLADYCSPPR
ncbi:MAG: PrsW family intramembrane metalloprotease [Mycobacterium sp.]